MSDEVPSVTVLMPAFNEAARIGITLAALADAFRDNLPPLETTAQIVVIDDGSADNTSEIAEAAGADIVLRQANGGKGAALQAGLQLATGRILLLLDADLGETAREATKLLLPILTGEADMTIATFPRIAGKGGGIGLVVRLARWGIRRLTRQTMTTPLSGQRAVRTDVVRDAGGFASGWGVEIALTVNALRRGYRVREVPTEMTHRVTGRSPAAVRHRAAQFVGAARVLWQLWTRPLPHATQKTPLSAPAVVDRQVQTEREQP